VVTSAKSPGAKCFGFIVMSSAEETEQAIKNLHNTKVQGQTITVEKVLLTNCVGRVSVFLLCYNFLKAQYGLIVLKVLLNSNRSVSQSGSYLIVTVTSFYA